MQPPLNWVSESEEERGVWWKPVYMEMLVTASVEAYREEEKPQSSEAWKGCYG